MCKYKAKTGMQFSDPFAGCDGAGGSARTVNSMLFFLFFASTIYGPRPPLCIGSTRIRLISDSLILRQVHADLTSRLRRNIYICL